MKWWRYEEGTLTGFEQAMAAISLDLSLAAGEKQPIISVVGAGGKTTFIYQLAEELKEQGIRTLVTTTTHMEQPKQQFCDWSKEHAKRELARMLAKEGMATVGVPCMEHASSVRKIKSVGEENFSELTKWADVLLVEADGSAKHPIKVPDTHEPVLFPGTTLTVGILSAGCIGSSIKEAGHRPEKLAAFLGKKTTDLLEQKDLERISESADGLLKYVDMPHVVLWTNVKNVNFF